MDKKFRDPISGFTHLFGAIASLVALIAMIIKYARIGYSSKLVLVSSIIFGVSLIFLYTASSVYHLVIASDGVTKVLRKLDHSMIFVLIAGTYTPICLIALQGYWRWGVFISIWSLAILGVLLKIFWFNSPRMLSTAFYIFMGWILVAALRPLSKVLPTAAFVWLFVGGVFYTVGGIIYALKAPNISKKFGFHELFHIFVLLGSFSHFILVYNYII
ncbi:PAQR family membrane homeostasis protein TrhA [Clostridium algidicarnis]|uniref:PAQR family membrane homeostasis protein TrhA n=1 Tax=Clostridium algidicarnis TaxID=37659 RepID=UPI001C0B2627|nr:hemolysin III family protein [Clostridium algidicarnis]MBU3196070.1 hemolysin III family protein [Clostridium algidicarnis]MBU3209115.1 hemolysin III family protein [Clostridium algidicarnis]MBU3228989.1 hemolysin III family protein [Clostridium algidicarnis]MBU3252533.1 hemolysin III family protein [Clostridium algidicarnis]